MRLVWQDAEKQEWSHPSREELREQSGRMIIYSHRGKHEQQKHPNNSSQAMKHAGELGYGMELDVRWALDNGVIVVSHDPTWLRLDLELIYYPLDQVPSAINVKDRGLLYEFKRLFPPAKLAPNSFVFDFELHGAGDEVEKWLEAGYRVAKRYSDHGEEPEGSIDLVWFDEMDETGSLLHTKFDPAQCIYVSPELHGRPIEEARVRIPWFGVCTDEPEWWTERLDK